MKKLSIIAAMVLGVAGLCAGEAGGSWPSDLTVDTNVEFSSERVIRGRCVEAADKIFTPSIEIGYRMSDEFRAYVGVDAYLSIGKSKENEVAPYIGMMYDATDMFTLDIGYIHHFYTTALASYQNSPSFYARNTSEIYAGVMADVLLSPSLYAFYDFKREEVAIEGKVKHNFDLSQYVISGLGIDVGAKLGFTSAKKPYGTPWEIWKDNIEFDGKKGYCYYGVNADLVYSLNNNVNAKVGVAYEGNSAKKWSATKYSWANMADSSHKDSVWMNASVNCSF